MDSSLTHTQLSIISDILQQAAQKTGVSTEDFEHWKNLLTPHIDAFFTDNHCSTINTMESQLGDLAHILNNIRAYIFIKDINGCYTYANRFALELMNCRLEDIIGQNDSAFFSADTVNDIYQNDQKVLLEGQAIESEEVLNPNSLSERRVYWAVKTPLYDKDGKIRGLCGISTDITERKQIEDSLRGNQELLATVLDNIGACIYMKSPDGRYLYANAATATLHNLRPECLIGLKDNKFFTEMSIENFKTLDDQVLNTQNKVAGMEVFQLLEQEPRYYWSVKVPLQQANGKIYAILGMSTDITERKRLEDELLRLATTDELTNLNNRRHFLNLAEQTLNRSRRYNEPLALLMCDIDFFKHINDTFGHAVGDQVLQQVAEIIRSTLRDSDVAGRIGGEEFAILLVQTNLTNAHEVAERLRQKIEDGQIHLEDGQPVPLTISIGVSTPIYPLETLATLLQHADQGLYQAKRSGRNKVCVA